LVLSQPGEFLVDDRPAAVTRLSHVILHAVGRDTALMRRWHVACG
jgi:hypothetical protein